MNRRDPFIEWSIKNAAWLTSGTPLFTYAGDGWIVHLRHREGLYQVEEIILAPNVIVPEHRHPHIDSVEYYLSGAFTLIVSGHRFNAGPHLNKNRRSVPIRSTDWHGAEVGPEGARFLSVQQWSWHVPVSSVSIDWEGSEDKVIYAVNQ